MNFACKYLASPGTREIYNWTPNLTGFQYISGKEKLTFNIILSFRVSTEVGMIVSYRCC